MSRTTNNIAPLVRLLLAIIMIVHSLYANAQATTVAVASNFRQPLEQLIVRFQSLQQQQGQSTLNEIQLVSASSGKLYAQILHGAPYALFLSADNHKTAQLYKQGWVAAGKRRHYAYGKLALLTTASNSHAKTMLQHGDYKHLAIANPRHAPYGKAAMQVLTNLNHLEDIQGKLVTAENIAQSFQFVDSGHAQLGFVAQSQIQGLPTTVTKQVWLIPTTLHDPIVQEAVMLKSALNNATAQAFWQFLQSEEADQMIKTFGYNLPQPSNSDRPDKAPQ